MNATGVVFLIVAGLVGALAIGLPIQQTLAGRSDGAAYGAQRGEQSCLETVVGGSRRCTGLTCMFHNRAFYGACLEAARDDMGLCSDVPRSLNVAGLEAWKNRECRMRGRNDRNCDHIMRLTYRACRERRRPRFQP